MVMIRRTWATEKPIPDAIPRTGNGRWIVASALVFLLAFLASRFQTTPANFNPDESRWISRAYFVAALRDPSGPAWQDSYRMRGQPPVGSYVTGLGLLAQGRDLTTNPPWNFTWKWEKNLQRGNRPTPEDLDAARRTSAILIGFTAVVVLGTVRMVTNALGAMTAAVVFAVHPFNGYIGSLATADACFMLFIAIAALAAGRLAARPGPLPAVALGIALGLGAGAKISPLGTAVLLGVFGGVLLLIDLVRTRTIPRDWLGWGLVLTPLLAGGVFIVVYPYLWPDPFGRTLNLLRFRTREMSLQASDWPVMAVPTRTEAFRRIGVNFHERYSLLTPLRRLGWQPPAIELAIAAAGGVVWLADAVRAGLRSPTMLVLLTLVAQVAVTVAGMRSEFDRYHVPMALLGCMAIGVAVGAIGDAVERRRGSPNSDAIIRSEPA